MIVVEGGKLCTNPEKIIEHLRMDRCPDCLMTPLEPGPRGGASQNLRCTKCGSRWNIAPPRYVMFAQRIE